MAAQLHPLHARRRVATSASLPSDLQPALRTWRFASSTSGFPRPPLRLRGCPLRLRTDLVPPSAFGGIPPGSSSARPASLRPSTVARLRRPRDPRLTFGPSAVFPPGPSDRPSLVESSHALVGPSTRPVRVSPPGRARRAFRRRTGPRGASRSDPAMPLHPRPKPRVVGHLQRHEGAGGPARCRPRVIPDVASSRAHLSVRTGCPGCETDGGRLPWGLGPYDAFGSGQRLAPGLPHPVTQRLQAFSAS